MNIERQLAFTDNEASIHSLIQDWDIHFIPTFSDIFLRSEGFLKSASAELLSKIEEEDSETRESMFSNPWLEPQINPDISLLRHSHFITIHSEFEQRWDILRPLLYKNLGKAPEKYSISNQINRDKPDVIVDTIFKWQVLFSYNFLRNKILHGKASPSKQLEELKRCVEAGEIKGLTVFDEYDGAYFHIGDEFITGYENATVGFLKEVFESVCPNR
jgi:hypothetical protein